MMDIKLKLIDKIFLYYHIFLILSISITPIYKKVGHFNYLFFSKKLFALKNK